LYKYHCQLKVESFLLRTPIQIVRGI